MGREKWLLWGEDRGLQHWWAARKSPSGLWPVTTAGAGTAGVSARFTNAALLTPHAYAPKASQEAPMARN